VDFQVVGEFLDAANIMGILVGNGATVTSIDFLLGRGSSRWAHGIRSWEVRLCEGVRTVQTYQMDS
jgi:hypothetical protein